MSGYNLEECLQSIPPTSISYQEFIEIGMALKSEGLPFEVWDSWAKQDHERYKGTLRRKWDGFSDAHAAGSPVAGGTIVQMARDYGWEPTYDMGEAMDWDDEFTECDPPAYFEEYNRKQDAERIVDVSWVEDAEIPEPGDDWLGSDDMVAYLEALFEPGETVGYVVESWQDDDGRWKPQGKGPHKESAGDIIQRVKKYGEDFASSIGWNNHQAGAWIRLNPLDGQGVRNDNVAEFRHALVESDNMAIGRQLAIMRQLELPIAALVHSGGKSLHAIVKVDAKDYDEYRRRVDKLYSVCRKNGLTIDTQNKNPSRLTRLPGVMRAGRKQYLIATNIGQPGWNEWAEWIEEQTDDLPEPECLVDVWDNLPELAPPLIDGVLRQGHKMLLAGPSKAGKSFALIELCIAIAEGLPWLGFNCAQGRVLYVNLELDRASCLHRFKDVYKAMGCKPKNLASIDIWNLRGKSKPMDKLAPSLIRRALKTRPAAVVIDPIYKVITGDENSADQMAAFCNQFDKVADSLGCAVIYCHHHSKGAQGAKRSMDRASGSGVFARDPDALLDLIELEYSDACKKQQSDMAACTTMETYMKAWGHGAWLDTLSPDVRVVAKDLLAACKGVLNKQDEDVLLNGCVMAREKAEQRSAWRIEGTLREFASFKPLNVWFSYPSHAVDTSDVLKDAMPLADAPVRKAKAAAMRNAREAKKTKIDKLVQARREQFVNLVEFLEEPTRQAIADEMFPDLKNRDKAKDKVTCVARECGYELACIDKSKNLYMYKKAPTDPHPDSDEN